MLSTQISARQATIGDLESVADLFDSYRQFYGKQADRAGAVAFLRARFEHQQSILFLAFAGDQAVGFTQLYPSFSSVSLARLFILNDLYVDAAFRRHGAAKQLLDAAAQYANRLGAIRLVLSTAQDNNTAQALYASLGWQRDTDFCNYELTLRQ
jgi:GNAT superfamily N-acetyltransferase